MRILSRPSSKFGSIAALVAAALAGPMSASASVVTFAQYFQTDGADQQWSVSTSGTTTTVTASGSVLFNFSGVSGLPFAGAETAAFTLTATSTQVGNCGVNCGPGDSYVQPGYAGSFHFTDEETDPGADLLSGVFSVTGSPATTGAQFSSSVGGTGGSFNASATAGNLLQLVLTSDYLSFFGQTEEDASWSLSSLLPNFTTGTVTGHQAYPGSQFNAAGSGTFSSSPGPAAVPEPATMGVMGSGLIGMAWILRKRKTKAAHADVTKS
jgi:hypothetical protein